MKVALIQCPLWGTYEPPTGLAQLSSCLKKTGHRVSVLDLNIKLYLSRKSEFKNFWAWEQSDFWYRQEMVRDYCAKNSDDIDHYLAPIWPQVFPGSISRDFLNSAIASSNRLLFA